MEEAITILIVAAAAGYLLVKARRKFWPSASKDGQHAGDCASGCGTCGFNKGCDLPQADEQMSGSGFSKV